MEDFTKDIEKMKLISKLQGENDANTELKRQFDVVFRVSGGDSIRKDDVDTLFNAHVQDIQTRLNQIK